MTATELSNTIKLYCKQNNIDIVKSFTSTEKIKHSLDKYGLNKLAAVLVKISTDKWSCVGIGEHNDNMVYQNYQQILVTRLIRKVKLKQLLK
jgi:hypothetical protein